MFVTVEFHVISAAAAYRVRVACAVFISTSKYKHTQRFRPVPFLHGSVVTGR